MTQPNPIKIPHRFTLQEFSGSLGDIGLFLSLSVALAVKTDLHLSWILITAGLMNILTGLIFRQPIPVQPMKAIAAIAIAEGLLRDEIVAAGLWMGLLLMALALTGMISRLNHFIPKAIVRGIQLGVGLKLAIKGMQWITPLPFLEFNSITTALIVAAILLLLIYFKQPGLLYIFLAGFVILALEQPNIFSQLTFSMPTLSFHWPEVNTWLSGLHKAALPQLPLTLLNSVVAVCALSGDYFPGRGIAPKRMAISVGLMNLLCVPFGGMPMCHGSGGLAAQYRFGARTGGSVIMLGIAKIIGGLLFGVGLVTLLDAYPISILAIMLIFAGVELAKAAHDLRGMTHIIVAFATAVGIIAFNTWVGFLIGIVIWITIKCFDKISRHTTTRKE